MEARTNLLIVLGEWLEARRTHPPEAFRRSGHLARTLRWFLPNGGTLLTVVILLMTQSLWARPFAALNTPGPSATTVNYQGRLADNAGAPLEGSYAMRFALYDVATDGILIWGPEIHDAVPVSGGLFSVGLGSQTAGGIPTNTWNGDRYLEITVGGETLTPRELIRSVPIAGMALTVPDGAIGTSQIADGTVTSDKLASGGLPEVVLDGTMKPVLIQTGQITNTPDTSPGYVIVNFDHPFKTGTVPRITISQNSYGGYWPGEWYVVLHSNTGFRIYRESNYPASWDWIAIGEQ